MAAMLRLGSRDRSSFLFKKSSQQTTDGISGASDAIPPDALPSIAHLDTGSFVGLFDRYQSADLEETTNTFSFQEATPSAKDFAWPVASPLHSSSVMLNQAPSGRSMSYQQQAIGGNGSGLVARNDSTGSSSVALSSRSESSLPMTRHSSASSIMGSISPLPEKTEPSGSVEPNTYSAPEASYKLKSRASTWAPSTSTRSQPDLDKPLPAISSRQETHLKGDRFGDYTRDTVPCKYPSLRKHTRSSTAHFPLTSKSQGSLPSGIAASPDNSRGARLGRAMVDPYAKLRSKSATLLDLPASMSRCPQNAGLNYSSTPKSGIQVKRKHRDHHTSNPMSSRTAENVIFKIMCHLDDVKDLQSTALVSKGFLNTYRRNESKLVSHMILKSSRAAWELRRSILTLKGSKVFRLTDYMRDLRTIGAIKSFILSYCGAELKPKTAAGLDGQDEQCELEADNALWRIWTFCALFGSNATQTPLPVAEIDWLNGSLGINNRIMGAGFAVGNGTGLSSDELEDVMELWTCLQKLLAQFHGREDEAERAGIFESWHTESGMTRAEYLKEWTSHLLTLGPQVVLTLASGSFERAKMLGLTQWVPPSPTQTRAMFLTSAISHVYQERVLAEASAKAAQISIPRMASARHRPSKSADIMSQRQKSLRLDTTVVQQARPLSVPRARSANPTIRPDCDLAVSAPPMPRSASALFPASPTNDPTFFHTLSMTANASTKLGATLFPLDYTSQSPRIPFPSAPKRAPPPLPSAPTRTPPPIPGAPVIVDPTDKHMSLLVYELGFNEHKARRALAMCDTGSGIDVQQAIELLMVDSKRDSAATTPIELPTPVAISSPLRPRKSRRDVCSGECRRNTASSIRLTTPLSATTTRMSTISSRYSHTRSKSTGAPTTPTAEEALPISPVTDIYGDHSRTPSLDSSLDLRREELDLVSPLMTAPILSSVRRMGTKKAWKVLGVSEQDPLPVARPGLMGRTRSKSQGVVGMEEYEKRVERRRSQRILKEQKNGGIVKAALGENLKGLGLGGLGGLRVVERELAVERKRGMRGIIPMVGQAY